MTEYNATIESIGGWDGLEQEAVNCWNHYISPELKHCYAKLADETGAEGAGYGYIANHAWEMFCATDDDETFKELGERVAAWVRNQS